MPVVEHELPTRDIPNKQHTVAPIHKWYDRPPSTKEEREEIEKFLRWRFPERYVSTVLEDWEVASEEGMTDALYYGDNFAILHCISRMRRPLETMNDARKLELGAIGNRSNGSYFDLDVL